MRGAGSRRVGAVAAVVASAVAAVVLALLVTPATPVTAFGQDLRLGAVSPLAVRGWSGPGQADLFGEGPVETALRFDGIVRPRIVWQRFDRDPAAADFVQTSPEAGPSFRTAQLGEMLARGWTTYIVRLTVISALLAAAIRLVLFGAAAVLRVGGTEPVRRRARLGQVGAALGLGAVLAAGSAALTVASARDQLSTVSTLADITGRAPLVPSAAPLPAGHSDVELAVIGDSTAAGVGNRPLADPNEQDTVCGRSRDAYARVLASALQWGTANLACSSATVEAGLLGPQSEGATTAPPQVGVLKSIPRLRTVVVSIGANDVGWADFLRLCFGLERCDDQFSQRLFDSRIDAFRIRYAQLLQQLSSLPTHPRVVVVQYYDPFGDAFDCPALRDPAQPEVPPPGYGFGPDATHDQQAQLARKIEPLRSRLVELNTVLAEGAAAFGFASAAPSFDGHALCADESWVQGMAAQYPFHPNAAGELAIAASVLPVVVAAPEVPR